MKYISGYWADGSKVTVELFGNEITRTVRYNKTDGLYIVYKNKRYFEYECEY